MLTIQLTPGELAALVDADAGVYNRLTTDAARNAAKDRRVADYTSAAAKLAAALDEHAKPVLTAWDLIGYDGDDMIRVVGGRSLYETAIFYDGTRQRQVKLARLEGRQDGIHQVSRYVDPDTPMELVPSS